jgi:hypothetical protein
MKKLKRQFAVWREGRRAKAIHGADVRRIDQEVRQKTSYIEGTNPPPRN